MLMEVQAAFQIVLDLEESMKEHEEHHSEEEMREFAEKHAATMAAVGTAVSDVCLITFGMSLVVSAIEMLYRGVYHGMVLYLLVNGTVASLFTVYQTQIHNAVTVSERIRKFDHYIWGVIICVPLAVTGFLLSLTLGLDSDPMGLQDDFGVNELKDIPGEGSAYRTYFMRHMQTAAAAFAGLAVSSAITSTSIALHLGGVLYLARKMKSFCSVLLIVYGFCVAYAGFAFIPEEDFSGAGIYTMVGFTGVGMLVTGIVGVCSGQLVAQASRHRGEGDESLRRPPSLGVRNTCMLSFVVLLAVVLAVNIIMFVLAGVWASNIHTSVAQDWQTINLTMSSYCADSTDPDCHLTQEQFVHDVQASFQLAMIVGITTTAYLLVGLAAA